jgi:L-lactate dehydrogenase
MKLIKNKIVIVGAGMVGSATLASLLTMGMSAEIVLIDANEKRARGEAIDASHTTAFSYSPNVFVHAGGYEECSNAQIIIITAGPSAKPGENLDRLALAEKNISVVKEVMTSISQYTKEAIIIMVTNPVDIVTYVAQNSFDYPEEKIIGSGTVLDTARFRRILAQRYLVDTKDVNGFILGEHGDTAFATWSTVNIAGIPVNEFNKVLGMNLNFDYDEVLKEVKSIGHEVLMAKGFTNFGIASSICRLVKAVLLNELSIMPVTTTLRGEYGINDVALSIPCIISSEGIAKKLSLNLSEDEMDKMRHSAEHLKSILKKTGA